MDVLKLVSLGSVVNREPKRRNDATAHGDSGQMRAAAHLQDKAE